MIIFNLRFSEDYYDKEAMVNFLICTRKIGDTFKNLTQLSQTEHGVDAVCNYKQARRCLCAFPILKHIFNPITF